MKNRARSAPVIAVSLLAAHIAHASSITSIASSFWQKTKNHYYIGTQLAYNYDSIQATDLIDSPVPTTEPQRYDTNGGDKYSFSMGLRTGLTTILNDAWSIQWGLAYYYSLQQKLSGEYYARNTSPPDLTYDYKLGVQRAVFEIRAYYQQTANWSYFAGFNLGLAILQTNAPDFKTIVYPGGAVTPLDSSSKTKNSFGYGLSLGIDYCIHNHWHVSLGVSQLWLGTADISVNNGAEDILVNGGTVNPLQFWIGSHYQF